MDYTKLAFVAAVFFWLVLVANQLRLGMYLYAAFNTACMAVVMYALWRDVRWRNRGAEA